MKYRKKVGIEAFKYDGDLMKNDGKYYVPEWAVKAFEEGVMYYGCRKENEPPTELFIRSGRGLYHVSIGDYIILGIRGELYPCNSLIFEESYEPEDKREVCKNEFNKNTEEDKQKILDLLLPALQATHNLYDLIALTYLKEAHFEGVKAEFRNGIKYANTAMDSGTSMIRDILNQII